jgi:uncharacterized protein (TIGR02001 family)
MSRASGTLGVAAIFAVLALPATAETLSFGATLTTDYISRGASLSAGGAALQPYVEYGINGFYAGLWASNISSGADTLEVDAFVGYRWDAGGATIDLGYARYFYNVTGDQGGELYVLGDSHVGQFGVNGGIYLTFPNTIAFADAHVGVTYEVAERLSVSATVGTAPAGTYANAGATFAVSENFSVDARYHLMTVGANRFQASATINF